MANNPHQIPSHRYVKTENIRAGDVILEEEPWIWSLACVNREFGNSDKMVCHYCLLRPGKLQACPACKSTWYCSSTCQRADWTLRHKHGDCRMHQEISRMNDKSKLYPHEILSTVRRLIVRSASTRLYSAKQCDSNGNPDSPLWHALMASSSEMDAWVNVDRNMYASKSAVYDDLVRKITWKDLPDNLIEKRILASLVTLSDYGHWKNIMQSGHFPARFIPLPKPLALGACLEMSKFPNNCNPNAVLINEGRLVRMVALENIPNLTDVRLTRIHNWLRCRYERRICSLFANFGLDCYCARCCAGDSGEATLFALRCQNWAALYNAADGTSSGCGGIVTGLRRTDVDQFDTLKLSEWHGTEIAAVVDDPSPLSAEEANRPLHERAECQKCHSRYDKDVIDMHIMQHLTFMKDLMIDITNCERIGREKCVMKLSGGDKYFHPANIFYTGPETILFAYCLEALMDEKQLDENSLAWMQRCAQRKLTLIESEGLQQIDLYGVFMTAAFYSLSFMHLVYESRRLERATATGVGVVESYKQTAETINRVAMAALKKLGPLFVYE